jgi:hypothetical protein
MFQYVFARTSSRQPLVRSRWSGREIFRRKINKKINLEKKTINTNKNY